jgi:exonuclease VII large subunit
MGTDVAEKPMNKTERSQLRSVVRNRFELLHDQLSERAREVRELIKESIRAEHKTELDEAEQRSKALARRLKSVVKDSIELHHEMEAKGVKAPYSLVNTRREMGRSAGLSRQGSGCGRLHAAPVRRDLEGPRRRLLSLLHSPPCRNASH